jgi:hypothetical protein
MEEIYEKPNRNIVSLEKSSDGKRLVTSLLRVNFDGEVLSYYEGAEFPQRGFPTDQVLFTANILKAVFIGLLKIRPSITSFVEAFNYIGDKTVRQFLVKEQYRSAGMIELKDILSNFIFSLTSNRSISGRFGQILSHLIENDNAYRLRLVDIASETSKEKLLKSPRKEIKRLFKIISEREIFLGESIIQKFRHVKNLLCLLILIPKFRRAFKYAISQSNWSNLQYDNIDRYWAYLRTDYNFMGKTYEERMDIIKQNNFSLPIQKEL